MVAAKFQITRRCRICGDSFTAKTLPKEVGWVEFKHNNCEPTMIGQDRAIT